MVDKKYYLNKDGDLYFNDFVLSIDGDDFRRKNLYQIHLGEKTTRVCEEVFEGNYLTEVRFHKKIKWIESRAFANNRIEKMTFSRLEIPQIASDAFVGNPISLIIVPYETYDDYVELFSKVKFEQEVKIVSNIENKFDKLNKEKVEGSVIMIKALPIYGVYTWRVEKEEITDLETKMRKDENQYDFGDIEINGKVYEIYKDGHQNVFVYRLVDGEYVDITFDDFKVIYNDARKALL